MQPFCWPVSSQQGTVPTFVICALSIDPTEKHPKKRNTSARWTDLSPKKWSDEGRIEMCGHDRWFGRFEKISGPCLIEAIR